MVSLTADVPRPPDPPFYLLLIFCAIWGAAVIADSGVFSTLLSEEADTWFVGTALTAQTAIGFGLTTVSIQLVPILAETTNWQPIPASYVDRPRH
jgi:hypothetical protein